MVFQYTPFLEKPALFDKEIIRNGDQFQRMVNFLELSPFLTFDTETSGLAWYRDSKICGIAFAGLGDNGLRSFYVPIRHRTGESQMSLSAVASTIKGLLANDRLKIAHNFKFDEHMIRREGWAANGPRYDTSVAAKLYDENSPIALKTRAVKDLGIADAELYEKRVSETIDKLAKINCMKKGEYKEQYGYSHLPIDLCGVYACFDVEFTTQLYWFYENAGVSTNYSRVFSTEMSLIKVLCDMEQNGMSIDVEYLESLKAKLQIKKAELEENLFYHLSVPSFNIASDAELRNYLINNLGLPLSKLTKGKALAVDKEVLDSFSDKHPAIPIISQWREAEKLENTYTGSILDRLGVNNTLHCDFQQMGTIASRLSCKKPNLQNQPSDSDSRALEYSGNKLEYGGVDPWSIRRAYVVADPKEFIRVYFDYSQVELRVLAFYSQDPVMVNAYLNNEDIHSRTSLEVFGNKEKAFRRLAKIINFGLSYGMAEKGFARQANISIEKATEYLSKFFDRYAGISVFKDNFYRHVSSNNGFFTNLFGRPRRVPSINSSDDYTRGRAERQSIASLIQGSAGELTKESLVRVDRKTIENGWENEVFPVCTIHDENQYDVHLSIFPEFCRMVKKEMEDFSEFAPIPIIVDGEYTLTNWSEKKSLPSF